MSQKEITKARRMEQEYCLICDGKITDEDYEIGNVKVPIQGGLKGNEWLHKYSVHVTCEEESQEINATPENIRYLGGGG